MIVEQFRVLPFSSDLLKDLVCDINSYKQFVPYLHDSSIISEDAGVVEGKLTIKFGPFLKSFNTLNSFNEDREVLNLSLKEGPFRDFKGHWSFEELSENSTRVGFFIEFNFRNSYFDKPFEHAVGYIYSHIIDSFAQEAHKRFN